MKTDTPTYSKAKPRQFIFKSLRISITHFHTYTSVYPLWSPVPSACSLGGTNVLIYEIKMRRNADLLLYPGVMFWILYIDSVFAFASKYVGSEARHRCVIRESLTAYDGTIPRREPAYPSSSRLPGNLQVDRKPTQLRRMLTM